MRCMERNKTRLFYALYTTKTPMRDDYGNLTGEYDVQHGKPMEFSANISAAKGGTTTRQFGENESYDKVIVRDADAPPKSMATESWRSIRRAMFLLLTIIL